MWRKFYRMTEQNRNTLIGLIALIVLIGGGILANTSKAVAVQYTYYAQFRTVDGIKINAPVYIFGVQVGKVSHMQLINGQAQVTLSINQEVKIPIDSSLEVQTAGLFAEKSMTILLGFETNVLQNNGVFSYTSNAVNVLGLLNQQLNLNILKRKAEQ